MNIRTSEDDGDNFISLGMLAKLQLSGSYNSSVALIKIIKLRLFEYKTIDNIVIETFEILTFCLI